MEMNLDTAQKIIEAAKQKAAGIGVPMVVAVVDQGGDLMAMQRMDSALLVSVDIAVNKAFTSVALKMATADLAAPSQPGKELFGIHNACGGRVVIFGGGIPLKDQGRIVGAIGVSGGSVAQDVTCAEAGVARFQELSRG